jgi:uncharacterized protein YjbI with pentapeptide repeats
MNATELKAILAQHKLWIESGRKKGKHAYLHSANLEGANLEGATLRGANLLDANLLGAYLQSACLIGANLQGATFDLNFKKIAYFKYVTFSEDQIAWVCLHPKYHEWADTLKWVKAERLSA